MGRGVRGVRRSCREEGVCEGRFVGMESGSWCILDLERVWSFGVALSAFGQLVDWGVWIWYDV